MNRKLHNTLLGLTASASAMALCLALAIPTPKHQPESVALQLGPVDFTFTPSKAGQTDAQQIEALLRSVEKRADHADTLAEAATIAAEVAAAAALAGAYQQADAYQASAASEEQKQARTASRHRRQTLVMPYFSFAPRG